MSCSAEAGSVVTEVAVESASSRHLLACLFLALQREGNNLQR